MTDSMNFGPDWIRNLSSEGSNAGGSGGGTRYQLADYRYGREDMLALFDRNIKPPANLANFKSLYSDIILPPLALLPTTDEERAGWQGRPLSLGGAPRGRGTSLERGGRVNRSRGGYQGYGRPPYEGGGGWGNGEQSDWSPRKEYGTRPSSVDNWRRARHAEEDDGWRMPNMGRGAPDKWGRQSSWRADNEEERSGPPERGGRWNEVSRGPSSRRSWENEEHLPEWANDNPVEGGGSFDDRGAFHGSDDEQPDGRSGYQKKEGLQKSTSQQHISHKNHPPLLTSKSTISLVKDAEQELLSEDKSPGDNSNGTLHLSTLGRENKLSVSEIIDKSSKEVVNNRDRVKSEGPGKSNDVQEVPVSKTEHKVEENDFERLQEDFVSKLVVDEDPPKNNSNNQSQPFDLSGLAPPPNLPIAGQDKWFYQDPQGQMQGPFTNMEMSEWFKAGYFGQDLKVRRHCDERFYLLGELIAMCNSNPFQTSVQFPVLKNDISKMPEHDRQFQMLPQIEAYKQAQARVLADPWSALALRQHELVSQRLILQQQQVQQDMQYVQPHPPTNPFMHMISQMQQQANKLPPTGLIDNSKQPPNLGNPNVDPHLHMMTNFLTMQGRLPNLANPLPAGLPGTLPPDNLAAGLSGLPAASLGGAGGIPMQAGLTGGLGLSSSVEHNSGQDNDPISKLIKQLHQEKQQQHNLVESFWQQSQFVAPSATTPQQSQWPGQSQPEVPMSMWDFQQSQPLPSPVNQKSLKPTELSQEPQDVQLATENEKAKKLEKTKETKQKEDEKELKRRKKAEEEQQKKEAEEKRKQEQRKQEADKKAEAEKRKKEEERIKKELEKAKKEAEDKRLRELEEKRRLKEQRKLEEEEKKRSDEEKRQREEERMQKEREQREREEKRLKVEETRRQEQLSMTKAAPWSQANSTLGTSLAEIQKAEKERKAQEAIIQAQKAQERELQLQQQQLQEKSSGIQLGWAKKAMEPRKVKSLAEIQAEEQERLTKEVAEARLKKEKEARESISLQTTSTIWSGQSLSWANASSTQSQWSSANNISSGFWDEPIVQKSQHTKPSSVAKSSSMSTMSGSASKPANQPTKQQQKSKPKKEETATSGSDKKNHNNNVDEFTNWCYKALSSIDTNVDVPTFVSFLRDIESAFEVREYCKMYLGEGNNTQQFANNFLEKRRSFKPKNAHKDDMCSPAPAITPSVHNNAEFQEVKGKNKKTKKSKMLKVDSRILGFNVTSAQDRINVGDRDYGDNP